MARNRKLDDLLNDLAPQVRDAFLASIQGITSEAQIKLIERAIRDGNIQRALGLLNLESAFFAPLDRALREAYEEGGQFAVDEIISMARGQGVRIVGRFDAQHPDARDFVFRQSSRLVVDIIEEQRDALRGVLASAFDQNKSPRRVALDIVGRVNRATGRREGGVIGLTNSEIATADRAYDELRSGSRSAMSNYLGRKTRNRSFDPLVVRAIQDGKPVPASVARKIIGKMKDNMLRVRGERIARTELLGGLHHANNEALEQMIEAGKVSRDAVQNEWDAANDMDTRDSHAAMDGQVRPQGQPFVTGAGYQMRFPGDRSLGAPASEIINCRCRLIRRIDFISELGPGD